VHTESAKDKHSRLRFDCLKSTLCAL